MLSNRNKDYKYPLISLGQVFLSNEITSSQILLLDEVEKNFSEVLDLELKIRYWGLIETIINLSFHEFIIPEFIIKGQALHMKLFKQHRLGFYFIWKFENLFLLIRLHLYECNLWSLCCLIILFVIILLVVFIKFFYLRYPVCFFKHFILFQKVYILFIF